MLPTPVLDLAIPLLPVGAPPLDLRPLLQNAHVTPTTLTHLVCGRRCTARDLPCTLVPQPGQVQIINLAHYNGRVDVVSIFWFKCEYLSQKMPISLAVNICETVCLRILYF